MARVFTTNLNMASGSKWGELRLDIVQGTQNIANNTTAITYELYIQRTATTFGGYYSNYANSATLTIDGTAISISTFTYDFRTNYKKSIKTGSMTITHSANGTKTVSASASVSLPGGSVPSGSGSGSLALTTIPRTSTFTAPTSFNVGSAFSVSIARASSSFTHEVSLFEGSTAVWYGGLDSSTSISVNIPANTLITKMSGVKSKAFTLRVTTYSGSTLIGSTTKTITANIPISTFTIPTSFTMGNAFTVSISRVGSLTHWVSLHNGEPALYSSGNNVTTSNSVSVALSTLAATSPSAMSKVFTVRVDTYNGSFWVGRQTKNITGNVPSTVKPTFSAVTVSENVSTVASLVGAYVQTKSKLNLAITGAGGIYGSTIKSYNITGVGRNVNSSSTVTDYLSVSGNQTITGTIIDSRGQTFVKSVVVNILPYTAPTLSDLSFRRTLPDKTEAPLGDNATVKATVKVQSLIVNGVQKNSIKYQVQSAQSGGSFATKADTTSTGLTKSYSDVWVGYSVDHAYNFRVRAGDVFGFGAWSVGVIPTGVVTQQWGSKTTSFGKMIDNTSYNVQVGAGGIQNDGAYVGGRRYATIFDKSTDNLNDAIDEWLVTGPYTQNGTGTYSYVQTIIYSNIAQRRQIAWGYNNKSNYTRWLYGGSWSPWTLMSTSAMAHGSGATGTFTEASAVLAGVTYYTKIIDISFGMTFSEAPVVVCHLATTAPHYASSSIMNITTTGFRLTVARANTLSTSYRWDAIGLT